MSKVEPLRIVKLEAVVRYVSNIERSRKFYTSRLNFAEIGSSENDLDELGKVQTVGFEAGNVRVLCTQALKNDAQAARWHRRHPDGMGKLVFEVEDADFAFRTLEARGGTPTSDVRTFTDDGGTLKLFAITTPFGDTEFVFVERKGYLGLYPGFERYETPRGGTNRYGFGRVDHVTSNFRTMSPALLWMTHVLGFEQFWNIEFHTQDVKVDAKKGSGLKSIVMWDPYSGVKFANNEPYRPFFEASQIAVFVEDHRGDGIQHLALDVPDILPVVRQMRADGITFMPTPGTYYDALPQRLIDTGIGQIDEDIATLRDLEILVDGADAQYLLQIFLNDAAATHGDRGAGPFFYEIIQRKGDQGFGGGNFRALFDSIERQQRSDGRSS